MPRGPEDRADEDSSSLETDPSGMRWTSNTLALIRYECYKVHRYIFRERERLIRGLSNLSDVSQALEEKRRHIEMTYMNKLDDTIPVQRYARLVGRLLISRFVSMLLHVQIPEIQNTGSELPVRDR